LTTVQETSKKLKLQIILSSVCFWLGVLFLVVAANQPGDQGSGGFPALMITVGLIWYITTRLRIWWHHK
jgi:hypothetical protein